jgi:hypothetical protein
MGEAADTGFLSMPAIWTPNEMYNIQYSVFAIEFINKIKAMLLR